MPLLLPKKYRDFSKLNYKTLNAGDRAVTSEIIKPGDILHGKIIRATTLYPMRDQPTEKTMFYQYKVAKLLFPKNFINVRYARNNADLKNVEVGGLLVSDKIEMDELSKKTLAIFQEHDPRRGTWIERTSTSEWKAHQARVDARAKPIADRLERVGVIVSLNPLNVWFDRKGNPVFFDIAKIDVLKLLRNQKNSKTLQNYLNRLRINMRDEGYHGSNLGQY